MVFHHLYRRETTFVTSSQLSWGTDLIQKGSTPEEIYMYLSLEEQLFFLRELAPMRNGVRNENDRCCFH